jgi:hypothetical protein
MSMKVTHLIKNGIQLASESPIMGKSAIQLEDNRLKSIIQKKQAQAIAGKQTNEQPIQKIENRTGLPDQLKAGIENLSGHSMDDVKVHYNSNQPAQLNAHAYAQGTDIHIAPGQEKHLPHEAWHVVQQKQGRVKPTLQMKGKVNVNDDKGLEKEADLMGRKAGSLGIAPVSAADVIKHSANSRITQRAAWQHGAQGQTWDELIDGVRWHAEPDGLMWFAIENEEEVKKGQLQDYRHLENKRKTWAEWNAMSIEPHPVPHDADPGVPDLSAECERIIALLTGFEGEKGEIKNKMGTEIVAFFKKAEKIKNLTKTEHPYVVRAAELTIEVFLREKPPFKFLDSAANIAKRYATGSAMVTKKAHTPMDDWSGELDRQSFGAGMGEGGHTHARDKRFILGSGGAGDCVVVIAYNPGQKKGFVVHAHRLTNIVSIAALIKTHVGGGAKIYLASQMFGKNGGRDSALVNSIMKMVAEFGFKLVGTYDSSSLAINVKTGEVRAGVNASALGGAPDVNEGDKITLRYNPVSLDF